MDGRLIVGTASLLLAMPGWAAAQRPVAGPAVSTVDLGGKCAVRAGLRSVPTALSSPCWLWTDDAGRPFTRRAASGGGDLVIVLAEAKPGRDPRRPRCAGRAQAVRVDAGGAAPLGPGEAGGTYCLGEHPEGAAWWTLEHDAKGKPFSAVGRPGRP